MTAGDHSRVQEGNFIPYEIHEFQSNGTTAITLTTKFKTVIATTAPAAIEAPVAAGNLAYVESISGSTVVIKAQHDNETGKKWRIMIFGR